MTLRVAINGFGRIGRLVLRAIVESGRNDIVVVGINDLGPVETNAHLLRYDSVHGRFAGEVTTGENWMDAGQGNGTTGVNFPRSLPGYAPGTVQGERSQAVPFMEIGRVSSECWPIEPAYRIRAAFVDVAGHRGNCSGRIQRAD